MSHVRSGTSFADLLSTKTASTSTPRAKENKSGPVSTVSAGSATDINLNDFVVKSFEMFNRSMANQEKIIALLTEKLANGSN